jgi:lipid A 4'-phosphatase
MLRMPIGCNRTGGGQMWRRWFFGAAAAGIIVGILFAAFPQWDLEIAGWFWDPGSERFPLATKWLPNEVRKIGQWTVWSTVLTAAGALIAKLVFPHIRMFMRPAIALFLLCSFAIGPGLVANGLKAYWARPRPDLVERFGGQQHFEPWWKPGGDCVRNCSFVSGDAAEAFWLIAPASVVPMPLRPLTLAAAEISAVGLSGLRVAFGRHFFTDVVFGGVLTIMVVSLCHRILLQPWARDDQTSQSSKKTSESTRTADVD